MGIDLHEEVPGAPQTPARATVHPKSLLVLASATTTSRVRHIVIEGPGHAGRITNLYVPQLLSLSLY